MVLTEGEYVEFGIEAVKATLASRVIISFMIILTTMKVFQPVLVIYNLQCVLDRVISNCCDLWIIRDYSLFLRLP